EVTVSVLWENPFRYLRYHNLNGNHRMYSIIETYINFLNEEECNEINQIIKNQEFNFQDIRKAIDSWYRIFKEKKFNIRHRLLNCGCEGYIMKSIMRQCQKLDFLNWGICLLDEGLLKIMQDKIKDLKYFTIDHHCGYYYETLGKKENNIKQAINNDTLIVLTKSCPNIYSLSISKTSSKSIKMVLSYLKDLKLATLTLQLFQIEKKGIVMKSKDLLNYIENEKSLFKLGLGKNDKYWDYYNVEILINF
ncbi:14507_t:CDS:2, partial [Rhizophagus irregularis]